MYCFQKNPRELSITLIVFSAPTASASTSHLKKPRKNFECDTCHQSFAYEYHLNQHTKKFKGLCVQILEKPCIFCQTPITGKGSVCTPCALGQKSNGDSDHGPSNQIPQFQLALGWTDYNTSCQNPH